MPLETDTHTRSTRDRVDRADAGEELAVDNRIDADETQHLDGCEAVLPERLQRAVSHREDMAFGNYVEKLEHFLVLLEDERIERGLGVLRSKPAEHGMCKEETPHLGEQDHEDLLGRRRVGGAIACPRQ